MSSPPHNPNWKTPVMGETQLRKRANAVVPSATMSGRADCASVQRNRRSRGARAPSTRRSLAHFHVSCTTKMLSAETPECTYQDAR
eukprot:1829407-Prymnesium_polylepis.2